MLLVNKCVELSRIHFESMEDIMTNFHLARIDDYTSSRNFVTCDKPVCLQTLKIPKMTPTDYYNFDPTNLKEVRLFRAYWFSNNARRPVKSGDEVKEYDQVVFRFKQRGWICRACKNFNFLTRGKCNICSKKKKVSKFVKRKP